MYQEDLNAMANSGNITIHNGFPNPALEHNGQGAKLALDLNKLLIKHPSSTYLFRVNGSKGDLVLIDRSLAAHSHDLVLIWQAGSGFNICRYNQISPQDTFWGVVSHTIRNHQKTP